MYYIIYLILFIVVVSIIMIIQSVDNELTYQVSTIDNKKYLVRNDERKQESANYMAKIRKNLHILVNHLKVNFSNDHRIDILTKKYNPDNLSESMKSSIYTSYSVNKGQKIVICIKEKNEAETMIGLNTVMFVVIHEISHIITKSIGHTDEFWNNMRFLLEQSINLGIYKKEDYKKNPKKYCGIEIKDSPLDGDPQ